MKIFIKEISKTNARKSLKLILVNESEFPTEKLKEVLIQKELNILVESAEV